MTDYQRLQQLASAPGTPVEGAIYYDTGGHTAKLWNGTDWEDWGGGGSDDDSAYLPLAGGTMSGAIAMGSNKVTGVGNPSSAQDAATKTYADNAITDALQPGVLGGVASSGITATINSSTGVLTFANFPTDDIAWWKDSSGDPQLLRGSLGSAPSGGTPGSVTSGNYMYVALVADIPTTPGGTATYAIYTPGTSRTTAALAAADQVTPAARDGSLILWDGIVHYASSTWSLVSGGSGSTLIPASTGRDRRPFARGARFKGAHGASYSNNGTGSYAVIDSTNLAFRLECSGAPVEFEVGGPFYASSGGWGRFGLMADGTVVGEVATFAGFTGSNYGNWPLVSGYTPSAGSHLFEPCWIAGVGTVYLDGGSATVFRIRESLEPNVNNGTA